MKITMKNLKALADVLLHDPQGAKMLKYTDPVYGTMYALNQFCVKDVCIDLLPIERDLELYFLSNGKRLIYVNILKHLREHSNMQFKELTDELLKEYDLEYSSIAEMFVRQYCAE